MTRRWLKLIFNTRNRNWLAWCRSCFDPDFRVASSIDEIVRAQGIVLTAATKLRRDVQQLWLETFVSVAATLRANERVVRDIAIELMNRRSVKASRLAYLLRSISGPALGRGDEP
jgi:hypothetical protein